MPSSRSLERTRAPSNKEINMASISLKKQTTLIKRKQLRDGQFTSKHDFTESQRSVLSRGATLSDFTATFDTFNNCIWGKDKQEVMETLAF